MSFGNRLRQLRLENNMTQEDLSKELNVSRATVGRYENDDRFPDKDTLKNIADIFNVSTDYLLGRINMKNLDIISKESIYGIYGDVEDYRDIKNKIKDKLILNDIIKEGEHIPKALIENIINYGIEAAIKIYLLESKLDEKKES
ncbi:helix-turn-helix domain-containing protein [Tissierellaceae bacterium HCP3S3_D8]